MKEETIETEGRRRRQTLGRLVSFEVFLPVLFGECLSSCHSPSVFCLSPRASRGLPLNCLSLVPGVSTSFVLELRHGGCSVWSTHGSAPLMIFGSLVPLWCYCIGPPRACASSAFVFCMRLMEVVHRFLPSEHILCWPSRRAVCFGIGPSRACASGAFALWMRRMEVVHWFLPSEHIWCWSSGRAVCFLASVLPERARLARLPSE